MTSARSLYLHHVQGIRNQLCISKESKQLKYRVRFAWTPSRASIECNELADEPAQKAATEEREGSETLSIKHGKAFSQMGYTLKTLYQEQIQKETKL